MIGALAYIGVRPKAYTAQTTVSIALPQASSSASNTPTSPPGPNPLGEVGSPSVARAAAAAAHLPLGAAQLGASENTTSGIVSITATAPSPTQAASAVNAAATAFAAKRMGDLHADASSLDGPLSRIQSQIAALQAEGGTVSTGSGSSAPGASGSNLPASTKLAAATADYQSLYQQQQTLLLAAESVQVSSPAKASSAALVGTSKKKTLELALAVGLLAGCGIALVREQFDEKIRSAAELSEIGTVGVLARLPNGTLGSSGTIAERRADGLIESVRELRTALRFLAVKRPLRTILVTSALPGDGKSFVSANLAIAWAMAGSRTVLVSSNLRDPSLENLLGVKPGRPGLTDAVANAALLEASRPDEPDSVGNGNGTSAALLQRRRILDMDLDELLLPTTVDGLTLLPAGTISPNPTELLESPQFAALLEAVRDRADVIVLDSPPVLAVTDALVLTAHVDGVLVVVAQDRTPRSAARRTLETLQSGLAPVLGIVLNRVASSETIPYPGVRRQGAHPEALGRRPVGAEASGN